MDASVAVVGLSLLANLVGLILSLWACFREVPSPVPTLPHRSRLSVQPPTCFSWSSGLLLWRSRSRGWSFEWVCFFAFLYFDLKLPGHVVEWRPNLDRVLVWVDRLLLLLNVLRSVDSNSVEIGLQYSDCNPFRLIDRGRSLWKRRLHLDFDNTGPLPLVTVLRGLRYA